MVRRLLALFKRKKKVVVKKHPLEGFLHEFAVSRARVRAIRQIRAQSIQRTGESTPHIERNLEKAIAKRESSFKQLRRARAEHKAKLRGQS